MKSVDRAVSLAVARPLHTGNLDFVPNWPFKRDAHLLTILANGKIEESAAGFKIVAGRGILKARLGFV